MALKAALDSGWNVRVVDHLSGTFHPKLYVGGVAFDAEAGMSRVSLVVAGSGNLSAAALYRNGECSYLSIAPKLGLSAGRARREFWALVSPKPPNYCLSMRSISPFGIATGVLMTLSRLESLTKPFLPGRAVPRRARGRRQMTKRPCPTLRLQPPGQVCNHLPVTIIFRLNFLATPERSWLDCLRGNSRQYSGFFV